MSVPVHHRIQWELDPCEHWVTCNCNHVIGGPAYCLICHKMRTVKDVQELALYPEKPSR